MTNRIHAAYNIATGEVLTSNHMRHLNRRVKRIERWNRAHGYGAGRWVFAHGAGWAEKLAHKTEKARL